MRCQFLLAVLLATSSLAADPDWWPKPEDQVDASDPRFEAIRVYRDAGVALRVHGYISDRCKAPGDEADYLLTDYQESFGAQHILKPLDFLVKYPDPALLNKLLLFQLEQTSSAWPPWNFLAIRLFREHPEEFDKFFRTLDEEQKARLVKYVRSSFELATEPHSPLIYPIPVEERQAIEKRIERLGE